MYKSGVVGAQAQCVEYSYSVWWVPMPSVVVRKPSVVGAHTLCGGCHAQCVEYSYSVWWVPMPCVVVRKPSVVGAQAQCGGCASLV